MNCVYINLVEVLEEGKKFLNGEENGEKARLHFKLDEFDNNTLLGYVIVKEPVHSVIKSFIQGLFRKSVDKLDKESFYKKYKFTSCDDPYMAEHFHEVIDLMYTVKEIKEKSKGC